MSQIKKTIIQTKAIKFEIIEDEQIVGRAFLYLIYNELHNNPYGLIEDIFVSEQSREKGYGSQLLQNIIDEAKAQQCYKLLAQSRYGKTQVHNWYLRHAFIDHGKNFRLNM